MSEWFEAYVGLPYRSCGRDRSGLDCWGLVRLVLQEQWGLQLPSYLDEYDDSSNQLQTGRAIDLHMVEWDSVSSALEGDVLLFRLGRIPTHVALAIDHTRMLHVRPKTGVHVARWDNQRWNKLLVGIFRHPLIV